MHEAAMRQIRRLMAQQQSEEIQAAVDGAEVKMKTMGDPIDMFENAYAQTPSYLQEQKEAFAREVTEITEEENSG